MAGAFEPEFVDLSAFGADGLVAQISYATWRDTPGYPTIPPSFASPYADAFKWGDPHAGQPATITYRFDPASEWTPGEQAAFQGAMALWMAVANVKIVEVEDAAQ